MIKDAIKRAALNYPELLPAPYGTIVKMEGFDALHTLTERFGGFQHYLPKTKKMFRECIAAQAKAEYTGDNLRMLAREYGYSEGHMRHVLGLGPGSVGSAVVKQSKQPEVKQSD